MIQKPTAIITAATAAPGPTRDAKTPAVGSAAAPAELRRPRERAARIDTTSHRRAPPPSTANVATPAGAIRSPPTVMPPVPSRVSTVTVFRSQCSVLESKCAARMARVSASPPESRGASTRTTNRRSPPAASGNASVSLRASASTSASSKPVASTRKPISGHSAEKSTDPASSAPLLRRTTVNVTMSASRGASLETRISVVEKSGAAQAGVDTRSRARRAARPGAWHHRPAVYTWSRPDET